MTLFAKCQVCNAPLPDCFCQPTESAPLPPVEHPLEGKLEPETRDMSDGAALYSIAISLKRIADALSPAPSPSSTR